jgi:hypothetical protein
MRYLITVVIAALSLNAFGQGIPQLPYNPDENGDGLISVPDLQALLSQYGLEFNSAVLSEDAQSAIVYMGEMAHPVCTQACENLPGFWNMATMGDLGLVWDEVVLSPESVWLNSPLNGNELRYLSNTEVIYSTNYPSNFKTCYCAAHELPKVEYKLIDIDSTSDQEAQINEAALEGWRLMPEINGEDWLSTMWRWAE